MIRRREFIGGVGSAALLNGLAFLPVTEAVGAPKDVGILADGMSKAKFEALLNSNFYVYESVRGASTLTLEAITERKSQRKLEQFSLKFRGSGVEPLATGTYQMEHPNSGRFLLHIERVGQDALGIYYRADLSLLI